MRKKDGLLTVGFAAVVLLAVALLGVLFPAPHADAGGQKQPVCHVSSDGSQDLRLPESALDGGHFSSLADYYASGPDNRIGRHGGDYKGPCTPTVQPTATTVVPTATIQPTATTAPTEEPTPTSEPPTVTPTPIPVTPTVPPIPPTDVPPSPTPTTVPPTATVVPPTPTTVPTEPPEPTEDPVEPTPTPVPGG